MSEIELDYEDALRALDDIAGSDDQVDVFIAGQAGVFVAGLGGVLHRIPSGLFLDEIRAMYVAKGGDADMVGFVVNAGEATDPGPCIAICRRLFQSAASVTQDELEAGSAAGLYWRGLTIFVGGVAVHIGVKREDVV